jgi:hypothetical protein
MNHIPHRPTGGSPAETLSINKRVLAEMIARAEPMGEGWRLPVLRAAYQGIINFSISQGGTPFPSRFFALTRPTIAIITDDHPGATGPGAWPQARHLFRWANVAILHAAGGKAEHSVIAVEAAVALNRVVQVEMELRHHAAWLALAMRERPRLRILNVLPTQGVHPLPGVPAGEAIQ